MGQNSSAFTYEGCATYSDANGNLLFYTNGGPFQPSYAGGVWNANHAFMDNGNLDSTNGCLSSRRGTFAFPDPAIPGIYHMLTTDCVERAKIGGLRYNRIDMNENGGLGKVMVKDSFVYRQPQGREDIHGLINSEGDGYWVFLVFRHLNGMGQPDTIVSFEVTAAGVSGPFQQTLNCPTCFYQASSPNGRKYIFGENLFDINGATGQFSNPIIFPSSSGLLSAAFSPNSNLIYAAQNLGMGSYLYQYRLDTTDIPASEMPIASLAAFGDIWGMQMGPDGKLYLLSPLGNIGAVECPNQRGPACNVNLNLMTIPNTGGLTPLEFPTYPAHFFASNDSCGAVVVGLPAENEQALFSVYPNPASEVVKIQLANQGPGAEMIRLRLISLDGREVFHHTKAPESFPLTLDLGQIPPGLYFIEARHGETYYRQRLILE